MLKMPNEYYALPVMGREIYDYWKISKPEPLKEMDQSGQLWSYLENKGWRLNDLVTELMWQGLSEDMAKELARAEIYDQLT